MEAFLIFCLLEQSPTISDAEQRTIQYNELTVALRGREPGLKLLQHKNSMKSLHEWATEIFDSIEPICAALDSGRPEPVYKRALDSQRASLNDYSRLPSARIIDAMRETKLPFAKLAFGLSEEHEKQFRSQLLPDSRASEFKQLAENSIREQAEIESSDDLAFEEFLQRYFKST